MIKDTTELQQADSTLPGLERRVTPELPDGVPAMLVRLSGEHLVMLTNPAVEQSVVEDCMAMLSAEMVRLAGGQERTATAVVHRHDGPALLEVPMGPREALAEEVSR